MTTPIFASIESSLDWDRFLVFDAKGLRRDVIAFDSGRHTVTIGFVSSSFDDGGWTTLKISEETIDVEGKGWTYTVDDDEVFPI
jgi:hypothetical protein